MAAKFQLFACAKLRNNTCSMFICFVRYSDLATTQDCYYNYNHYSEGDRILTNEPCLNCTCHNKMLMCYLKVCPFTKPIGQDCTIEKREDQCCPIITCPEGKIRCRRSRNCHKLTLALAHTANAKCQWRHTRVCYANFLR